MGVRHPLYAQSMEAFACPAPLGRYERITVGHGAGARLTHELITEVFLPALGGSTLAALEDQAALAAPPAGWRLAFTTDSFTVRPLFFPGGDIGKLAVHGTVNDLAVGGAQPRHLSAAFILEEGLPIATLARVLASMRAACAEAGVEVVAGDTKVVERGKGDQVFIATSGIGWVPPGRALSVHAARPGDQVLVSGTLGDHGIAVMASREGFELDSPVVSDTAPLTGLMAAIFAALGPEQEGVLRLARDLTRGGLTSALHEVAAASRVAIEVDEAALPVRDEVRGACELLGLDPLAVANEGKLVAVAAPGAADAILAAMRAHPLGGDARVVGRVAAGPPGAVTIRSLIGGTRWLTLPAGELLPRIC